MLLAHTLASRLSFLILKCMMIMIDDLYNYNRIGGSGPEEVYRYTVKA